MKLNSEFAALARAFAGRRVRAVLPFNRGDQSERDVCAGYGRGYGTTCSFLPHWMLAQLQATSENKSKGVSGTTRPLLNRNSPTLGGRLVPGDGISTIANSPAFVRHRKGNAALPQTGDIVIIQADPYKQSYEHVFVFLRQIDATTWETGEAGQARSDAADGAVDGVLKQRKMSLRNGLLHADAADGVPSRYVQGWLDISNLDYLTTGWPAA
ncbi:hypothetical protein [Roseomonas sp. HF4]|uniref:hypothetical protein n=1 Tax=Roseomonas sp. HF4 TaxID=2562313 RepID=UPI0010C1024D|nr:hypothetical protein [Roseomonas sp. HF4]